MNKENKGHLHAIKNRLSPSSSKPPSRLGSPIPPDESSDKDQQHSWSLRKFFGKPAIAPTQSTSPIPESSLNSSVATFRNDISAPQLLVTPPAGEGQQDPLTQTGPTITTSPHPADASVIDSQLGPPKTISTTKENLKVAGRFIQTLMTKVPEIVDGNPVKMAFSLAKVIITIKQSVEDNMDAVERKIASTGTQLETVVKALDGWQARSPEERQCVERLKMVLQEELVKLGQLSTEWIGRKVADYEDEKSRIAEIFERVSEARIQFGLDTDLRIFEAIYVIEEDHRRSLLKELQPSDISDHKYHLEGEKKEVLRRAVCTHGTRERLLADIITWAKGSSSETVYWLFGPAGSGKTTIAYTIARRFELAAPEDTIVLGGNFFSSRQFEETRFATRIIRTIVYHLALRCKAFADALTHSGKFHTVNQNVRAQLDGLLIGPWQKSESARLINSSTPPPQYLIVIDALDEIDGTGGSQFLRDLLDVINENRLNGLKFFATSRPDPNLVAHVGSFADKKLYRLEEVPFEEAQADIKTYLKTSLPRVGDKAIEQVVTAAAGLFIYASTIVKYLGKHTVQEQKNLLKKLFSVSTTAHIFPGATALLDELYLQILLHAFDVFEADIRLHRLHILFTFLCTPERTSTSVVNELLLTDDFDSDSASVAETDPVVAETSIADDTLQRLYAVLYTENNKVLWHHKSFPDFLFDQDRSKDFWCNQAEHHRRLMDSCFRVMKEGLRFNIANIASSFVFDRNNRTLPDAVTDNISPTLSYSCRNWGWHLSSTAPSDSNHLQATLSEFLKCRALFWIEAMNLLESGGLCEQMLRKASNRVKNTDSTLAEQLAEAASFALYFSGSPAASSTPHLYISALSTWPRDLEPCGRWRSFYRRIPVFKNAARGGALSLVTISVRSVVTSVAFSTDGTRIVSGSLDKLVRVWDATGKELNVLNGHTRGVNSVAFSTDGTRIVSGSMDKSVRVWDAATGKELHVLNGHTSIVNSVAFSTDGKWIVSGSSDTSVRVWDAVMGKELHLLNGHTNGVSSVAFSNDGTRILAGSWDKSVRVWDVATGKELTVLKGHTDRVNSVAFSNDGTRIVSGSEDGLMWVWDAATGKQLKVLIGHTKGVDSVSFSNDRTRIVSGSLDKSVRVWDAATGKELNVLNGHTGGANSVAFSNDGTRIVSGSEDRSVRVWDVATGKELRLNVLNGHTNGVSSVAFSTDGAQIVSGSWDTSVRVWDALTGKELNVLNGHTDGVTSVAFSDDGRRIVSGSGDESVRVWDAVTGKELKVLKGHIRSVNSVAFSNDGTRIVTGSSDHSVSVWHAATGIRLNVLGSDTEKQRWDQMKGKELNGHTNGVSSVAFSTDDTRIVSGSWDKSVRVWDAETGKELNVLKGHAGGIHSIAFSNDGTRIVSGSEDGSVRVWDAATGKELNMMNGHTDRVSSVKFSTDGTRIVSGSWDKSVWVWDALTGEELNVLIGHASGVSSVTFSTDGTQIVSGSWDHSIRVWDTQPRYIREHTNPFSYRNLTHSGWLFSPDGKAYLMFVPLDARLPDSFNILTIPDSAASSVDFTNAAIGPQWNDCYTP